MEMKEINLEHLEDFIRNETRKVVKEKTENEKGNAEKIITILLFWLLALIIYSISFLIENPEKEWFINLAFLFTFVFSVFPFFDLFENKETVDSFTNQTINYLNSSDENTDFEKFKKQLGKKVTYKLKEELLLGLVKALKESDFLSKEQKEKITNYNGNEDLIKITFEMVKENYQKIKKKKMESIEIENEKKKELKTYLKNEEIKNVFKSE